jgi:hypothetical protein
MGAYGRQFIKQKFAIRWLHYAGSTVLSFEFLGDGSLHTLYITVNEKWNDFWMTNLQTSQMLQRPMIPSNEFLCNLNSSVQTLHCFWQLWFGKPMCVCHIICNNFDLLNQSTHCTFSYGVARLFHLTGVIFYLKFGSANLAWSRMNFLTTRQYQLDMLHAANGIHMDIL